MSFFGKLKERLFKSSSKIEQGLLLGDACDDGPVMGSQRSGVITVDPEADRRDLDGRQGAASGNTGHVDDLDPGFEVERPSPIPQVVDVE